MNRFFLPPLCFQGEHIVFPTEVGRQIRHVLRFKPGQFVEVLDDRGWVYVVKLTKVTNERVIGDVTEQHEVDTEPLMKLTIFLSLTQREKFEWALQKCTEVGVGSFTPIITARSLVRSKTRSIDKHQRWMRIIQEAAEQSRRGQLPLLNEPLVFSDAVAYVVQNRMRSAFLWEGGGNVSMQQWCETSMSLREKEGFTEIGIFVGPEGGFTLQEVEQAQEADIQPVSLGKRILRMETAAVVGTAIVLNAFDELA